MRSRVFVAATLAMLLVFGAGCAEPKEPSEPTPSQGEQAVEEQALEEQAVAAAEEVPVKATKTTGVIRGFVVDEAIRPIAGATLRLVSPAAGETTSNVDGGFGFEGLAPGAYILAAVHPRYDSMEVAVNVEVAEDEPPALRVNLVTNAAKTPRIDAYEGSLFISSAFCLAVYGCNAVISGNSPTGGSDHYYRTLEPNATVVQVEVAWDPSSPLAETGLFECRGFADDSSVRVSVMGTSPLMVRIPGVFAGDFNVTQTLDSVTCELSPDDTQPAAVMANQLADIYVHAFYNFEPRSDWLFSRDGEHEVPE